MDELIRIRNILNSAETVDIEPPFRCLPIGDPSWIEQKAILILQELKKAGYVKLSKNQELPENPYELYSYGARIQHQEEESKGFKCCAEQMIKDNFRRVEEG